MPETVWPSANVTMWLPDGHAKGFAVTKTSLTPLVSPGTRLLAVEQERHIAAVGADRGRTTN